MLVHILQRTMLAMLVHGIVISSLISIVLKYDFLAKTQQSSPQSPSVQTILKLCKAQ